MVRDEEQNFGRGAPLAEIESQDNGEDDVEEDDDAADDEEVAVGELPLEELLYHLILIL